MKILEEQKDTQFFYQKGMNKFSKVGKWTSWRETNKVQIKSTTTCNKIEQEQDAKNNAEF